MEPDEITPESSPDFEDTAADAVDAADVDIEAGETIPLPTSAIADEPG